MSSATVPQLTHNARERTWRWLAPLLALVLVVLVIISTLSSSTNPITLGEAWRALWSDTVPPLDAIAVDARLPRSLLAIVAGASLAMSGALMQALTRNPLASPEITGVSSGAVAAVLCFTAFGPALSTTVVSWALPALAVAGGLLTAGVVYLLARRLGSLESTRFIMVGILFGGVLASVASVALIFLGVNADRILGWLAGSLSLKTWQDLELMSLYVLPGLVLLPLVIPRANALQLGDDVARGLGQRQDLDRILVLLTSVFLAAGTVAVVGAIGFVGLIAPHMVRRFVGSDLRRLVPATALAGAVMVSVADLVARNFDPRWVLGDLLTDVVTTSLPVGVYLQCFGVPFLIILLWRRRDL